MFSPARCILVSVVVAAALPPQNIDAGPFLALGTTYFVKQGTRTSAGVPVAPRQVYTKRCGRMPGTAGAPGGSRPNFTFGAMFPDPGASPPGPAAIDIDALSIGQDQLWVDPHITATVGRINSPIGNLLGLVFSVTPSSTATSGPIAAEAGDGDGIAADLWTFLPSNCVLPPGYAGQTFRSLDAGDIGLDTPPGFPRPDITAIDNHIQAYYLDDAFVSNLPRPTVWFSVTDLTKTAVPATWQTYMGSSVTGSSGARIYKTTWNPTAGAWTLPVIAFRSTDLGLNDNDDVDALAIDFSYPPDVCIVYSTTNGRPIANELVFVSMDTTDGSSGPSAYSDSDGQPVTSKLGGNEVRIDSVCGSDPGPQQSGLKRFAWGTPVPFWTGAGGYFAGRYAWIGAFRSSYTGGGGTAIGQVESFMSGWRAFPPPGGMESAVYCLTLADPTWPVPDPVILHAWISPRTMAFDAVESATIRYPGSHPSLYGMDLYSCWACLGATWYRSDTTRIRL